MAGGKGRLFRGKNLASVCKVFSIWDLPLNRPPGHHLSTEGLLQVFSIHYQTLSSEKSGLSQEAPPTRQDWAQRAFLLHMCHHPLPSAPL